MKYKILNWNLTNECLSITYYSCRLKCVVRCLEIGDKFIPFYFWQQVKLHLQGSTFVSILFLHYYCSNVFIVDIAFLMIKFNKTYLCFHQKHRGSLELRHKPNCFPDIDHRRGTRTSREYKMLHVLYKLKCSKI